MSRKAIERLAAFTFIFALVIGIGLLTHPFIGMTYGFICLIIGVTCD